MFVPDELQSDVEGFRTCGCCMESKPVNEFYKDGTDSKGEPKYRRDCKTCYRVTRLSSRRAKATPKVTPKPRTRGGRKK